MLHVLVFIGIFIVALLDSVIILEVGEVMIVVA